MSNFKRPMQHRTGLAKAPTAGKDEDMANELGFDSDAESEPVSSDDERNDKGEGDDNDDGGISFIEFLGLQRSLRDATTQKFELSRKLNTVREELVRTNRELSQARQQTQMTRVLMEQAQQAQLKDKDNLIDSLKISLEEIKGEENKTTGILKMVDQIQTLSNEKRENFERAERAEGDLKLAREGAEHLKNEFEEKSTRLNEEIEQLQITVDPVKNAKAAAQSQGPSAMDNEEIESLRKEAQDLRGQLREARHRASESTGTGTMDAAEAARYEAEAAELTKKNHELRDDLKNALARAAKMEALSASGADKDAQAAAMSEQLQADLEEQRAKAREAKNKAEELETQLTSETSKAKRLQAELDGIKNSLDAQMKELETAGGQAKDVQSQLQLRTQELNKERAALKAEQGAHEDTRALVTKLQGDMSSLKAELEKTTSESSSALRQERERSTTALQTAKAESAAALAEARQRAQDDMKEMRERLAGLGGKVAPMVEAIQFISKNYKKLRKEVRDLQGEIEPAVKQCKRDLLRTLAEVDTQYKEMLRKYRKEMALRKKLHNELVDLKGNIRVFARVRPPISEDGKGADSAIAVACDPTDDQLLSVHRKSKDVPFEMDFVFSPESRQEDVFTQARDVIVSVIDGYNVCIFAYGQTGSGKTFTMDGPDSNPGLNRRALAHLFEVVEEKKGDWTFEIEVSVLEIYNEILRDLLGDPKLHKKGLDIRHGKEGPNVPGLSRHPVSNAEEVRDYFKKAQKVRATSSTKMNEASSRSHALLVVYVTGTNLSTGVQTNGKLNLIDLAGSERVDKSGAIDDATRFKEATNINKSLSCLGDVIHALGAKQKHVPYRNSKLTHLLQDSLGGSAKTIMVVQVSPVVKNCDETVNSLNFAARVRAVELGSAKKQSESAEVASLRKRIKELEA